jgi:putative transposase
VFAYFGNFDKPVKADYVTQPTHWKYSSARNIANENPVFEIDEIGFLE